MTHQGHEDQGPQVVGGLRLRSPALALARGHHASRHAGSLDSDVFSRLHQMMLDLLGSAGASPAARSTRCRERCCCAGPRRRPRTPRSGLGHEHPVGVVSGACRRFASFWVLQVDAVEVEPHLADLELLAVERGGQVVDARPETDATRRSRPHVVQMFLCGPVTGRSYQPGERSVFVAKKLGGEPDDALILRRPYVRDRQVEPQLVSDHHEIPQQVPQICERRIGRYRNGARDPRGRQADLDDPVGVDTCEELGEPEDGHRVARGDGDAWIGAVLQIQVEVEPDRAFLCAPRDQVQGEKFGRVDAVQRHAVSSHLPAGQGDVQRWRCCRPVRTAAGRMPRPR